MNITAVTGDNLNNETANHSGANPICRCHCGFPTRSMTADYLPGHDARHASWVAKKMAGEADTNGWETIAKINGLVSQPLIWKAIAAADKIQDRAARKAEREAARLDRPAKKRAKKDAELVKSYREGTVKIGRWTYPARLWEGGVADRNTKRDGSGEWVEVAAELVEVA